MPNPNVVETELEVVGTGEQTPAQAPAQAPAVLVPSGTSATELAKIAAAERAKKIEALSELLIENEAALEAAQAKLQSLPEGDENRVAVETEVNAAELAVKRVRTEHDKEVAKAEKAAAKEAERAEKAAAKAAAKAEKDAKKETEKAEKAAAKAAEKEAKAEAAKAKKEERDAAKAAKAAERANNRQPEQNEIRRPKPGTLTGRVWELCDMMTESMGRAVKNGEAVPINMLLTQGLSEGLEEATIKTQYARWRKFHGITGRVIAPQLVPAPAPASEAPASGESQDSPAPDVDTDAE